MKATIAKPGSPSGLQKAPRRSFGKTSLPPEQFDIHTILVPTDFSRASLHALRWAKFMADQSGATVHLVHAFESEYPLASPMAPDVIRPNVELEGELRNRLAVVARKYRLADPKTQSHFRKGRAFFEICEVAKEIGADLIVTSTHGYTGWKHVFLGSTAERIVRHAPCPVLVSREAKAGAVRKIAFKRIVAPVDFSNSSKEGVNYALKLASRFGAKLFLIHVIKWQHHLTSEGVVLSDEAEFLKSLRATSEKEMSDFVRKIDSDGVALETAIKTGFPDEQICNYAEKNSADLIVTATHGRTGLRHVLIGSTAEHVVRYAKCPVLVVPTRRKS